MKNASFHDLLLEKMRDLESKPQGPAAASLDYEKFQAQSASSTVDLPPRFFRAPIQKRKIVPEPAAFKPVAPPPPPERVYEKSALDEEAVMKWNLFEKTFAVSLGERTTLSFALKGFRGYLKANHPDLTGKNSKLNFSTLVKIKDEFVTAVKK